MIERKRFALNRIICPSLGLEDFFRFTADLGISKVEVRNDLPGRQIIDGMPPAKAAEMAQRYGIRIISINALQKFNLRAVEAGKLSELGTLLELADVLQCAGVVMCPNNDRNDHRSADVRQEETVSALKAFGPSFVKQGLRGWVEPLGFRESSLSSIFDAAKAIAHCGFDCYRIVYDTFHHSLGPDAGRDAGTELAASGAGLIHVSGVESPIDREGWRDEHRVLPSPADRSASKEQVARMLSLGYAGDISFEPFSVEVQRMSRDALAAALRRSIEYLG